MSCWPSTDPRLTVMNSVAHILSWKRLNMAHIKHLLKAWTGRWARFKRKLFKRKTVQVIRFEWNWMPRWVYRFVAGCDNEIHLNQDLEAKTRYYLVSYSRWIVLLPAHIKKKLNVATEGYILGEASFERIKLVEMWKDITIVKIQSE